ncbi:MAG: AAA-associated domain-containing protein [Candidatus Subteraquimicrobiales bacterium]|nr:AAA-associated domain-containing protein [Candidatus Subteraquimicrobiales bacterium]
MKGVEKLTPTGEKLIDADINGRRLIVKEQVKRLKPFQEVLAVLKTKEDRRIDREFFMELFEVHLPGEDAGCLMHTIIEWGRHAELIGCDFNTEEIYLAREDKI